MARAARILFAAALAGLVIAVAHDLIIEHMSGKKRRRAPAKKVRTTDVFLLNDLGAVAFVALNIETIDCSVPSILDPGH